MTTSPPVPPRFHIAIVGSGPAGLSAGARAAQLDRNSGRTEPSYVLLESFRLPARTIQRYQKGKRVMAEPRFLDLRSDLRFGESSREDVLRCWSEDIESQYINVRFGAELKKLSGQRGNFTLQLTDGSTLCAEHVVLAIGVEGNPRRLGVKGEDQDRVQYQLDDPDEFRDERILVVGAGDSAIENALALARKNDVWLVVRATEFSRAKEANLNAVLAASSDPGSRLKCLYSTTIGRIARDDSRAAPLTAFLQTPTGEKPFDCHRVIARLGGEPARGFVESMGVRFPSASASIPMLSRQYESNVPGLYVIGSLAGYPLIKQAMNQGYDVVEIIHGNAIKPADHRLLERQFQGLPNAWEPDDILDRFRSIVPMFRELNALAFRELIVESEVLVAYPDGRELAEAQEKMQRLEAGASTDVHQPRSTHVIPEGQLLYDIGDFGISFFTLVNGTVTLDAPGAVPTRLSRGDFFGEISLLSGRPRTERAIAGPGCIVVETPRRMMLKLMSSHEEVRKGIEWIFIVRELQRHFAPGADPRDLREIASHVLVHRLKAGDVLFSEGDAAESLFILRSGNVRLSRSRKGEDVLVGQMRAGQLLGEMGLMGNSVRQETATAVLASELLEVKRAEFLALTRRSDARLDPLIRETSQRVTDTARMEARPESGSLMSFLMNDGLGEATNVLIIDESLCIGCDNCEKACAETHGGVSRLDRKAGATYANIHVPVSCRHCEQPHCMKDCPPNAIRRSPTGEVFIDDTCIGCGNCMTNCPYDVIRMEYEPPAKPGLLRWLLTGAGSGPGETPHFKPGASSKERGKKAMKCDACVDVRNGPACVKACPTGAAVRIGPERLVDLVEERRG